MAKRKHPKSRKPLAHAKVPAALLTAATPARTAMLPIGAMLLASSMSGMAQQTPAAPEVKTLPTVTVIEKAEAPEGKDALRATTTSTGKGNQQLRDVPQSVTVVTEKLMNDRNLNTLRDVLHNTAGVTFQAAEGGEEDIRLRGFSLSQSGDIYVDGMRDPAFYDRDTFSYDRVDLLRGSASMLFGHGSTGGVVNQVTKQARAFDQSEVTTTIGSHDFFRVEGDFNIKTGEDAGLRINAMYNKADNDGAGAAIDKRGIALNYRWGIGERDEFSASIYALDNNNNINYGIPWLRPSPGAAASIMIPNIKASAFYGLDSDQNNGTATYATFSNTHRFDDGGELKTQVRKGTYTRDLRSGVIRFSPNTVNLSGPTNMLSPNSVLTRGGQSKVQDLDSTYLQSDYSNKFDGWGYKHEVLAGLDMSWESKDAYTLTGAFTKPNTTVGNPDNGVSLVDPRVKRLSSGFSARNTGIYAQDLIQIAPSWKVLAGLRYDRFSGTYDQFNTTTGATTSSVTASQGLWSKRTGVLYQPNDLDTYYFSAGTSFNTSGDTYSYAGSATALVNGISAQQRNANTDPEGSQNFEFGAKMDSADKRFTTRISLFRTIKTNERNTDVDNNGDGYLLTGKRHSQGVEVDVSGRITPQWEVYGSYVWTPNAKIDKAGSNPGPGEGVGQRAWLTPLHSGTVWNTYQLTPQVRVGGGINFRSKQQPNRNPGFYAPSFVTLDLMAEYMINERFTVKANLTNATNKYYADVLYTGHYIPGAERMLQVSLTAKF